MTLESELVTAGNIGRVFSDYDNEASSLPCCLDSPDKRVILSFLGKRNMMDRSPHEAHEALLEILRTNQSNTSPFNGFNGEIYALFHHLLGGKTDLKQRRGVRGVTFDMNDIDDAFTIIYNNSSKVLAKISKGGLTTAPTSRELMSDIGIVSQAPNLACRFQAYSSPGMETAGSI